VSLFVLDIEPGADAGNLTRDIDERFESSENRTRTQTEAAFNQSMIAMWGNVPILLSMIGGAVLFAAFMIALNTMLLNARERRMETGVLKALGFPDAAVFLLAASEGVVVCGLGGALGTFGAWYVFDHVGVDALSRFFPAFEITRETLAIAGATSLGVGAASGVFPAFYAARMKVIDALARFG
jgi:putative ABC transport system permease protein